MRANQLPDLDQMAARRKREAKGPPCAYKKRYAAIGPARARASFLYRKDKQEGREPILQPIVRCKWCSGWHIGVVEIDLRAAARWIAKTEKT